MAKEKEPIGWNLYTASGKFIEFVRNPKRKPVLHNGRKPTARRKGKK